ncbi:secretion protein F [Furfurilactobacillus curtus]|uniref:Secretion protein F n=2 Tax=Furfurilactobacillus curtus TaxID=1746200 RepID=A0ABQ5JSS6_9LACO
MRSINQSLMVKLHLTWPKHFEQVDQKKISRLHTAQAAQFFSLMADVLAVGFSLREGLNFARIMLPRLGKQLTWLQKRLSSGEAFAAAIKPLVDVDVYYQIKIAEENGALTEVMTNLGNYLALRSQQQQKIRLALRYPLFILLGLGILLIGVKEALLPELQALNPQLVLRSPWMMPMLWLLIALIIGLILVSVWVLRQPRLRRLEIGAHVPVIGPVLQLYWHYYLSMNLGLLMGSGLQTRDVLQLLLSYQQQSVLQQLAAKLDKHLRTGAELNRFVDQHHFLPNSFKIFFSKGLTSAQLAKDLQADAMLTYQRLFRKIESMIGLIQPILFAVIGLAIVGLYLSLLLPMYQTIGGLS